ncbi:MAG: Hpt domain-containing protein [Planctomycetaceae bacterium]|nr:Hpt domain-containing protein [Planctomycetaceae bacterium]
MTSVAVARTFYSERVDDRTEKTGGTQKGPLMNALTQAEPARVVDHEELLKRCMGNQQFAKKILLAFQNQLTGDLNELNQAIHSQDYERITAIAHRIKGSSSNVSAGRLNQVAASLEEFSKDRTSQIEEIRSYWDQIKNEHNSLVEITTEESLTD